MDPQAHLTINYGVEPSPQMLSLYHVLVEEHSFLEAIQAVGTNAALVPGSIDLAAAEVELVSVAGRETLLKRRIEATQHDFDFILLDCPPSLGLLTINALAVASEVIIPMPPKIASSARVSFAEIETDRGHDAFLLDVPEFFDISRAFLQSAAKARGLSVGDEA